MDENVTIKIQMPENIPCKNCIWATTPYAHTCAKFINMKDSKVLYEGEPCPMQKPYKNTQEVEAEK